MRIFFKKQIAAVISVALTFSTLGVFSVSAAGTAVDEVKHVYDYLDAADINAVEGTANRLSAKINANAIESDALDRIYDAAKDAISASYPDENPKQLIVDMLAATLRVNYVTASDKLQEAYDEAKTYVLTEVVGDAEKWLDLMLLARKDVTGSDFKSGQQFLATGSKSELFKGLDAIQKSAVDRKLNETEYDVVKNALGALKIDFADIVDASRDILTQSNADDYNVGEFALIKAAARSSAVINYGSDALGSFRVGKDWENEKYIIRYTPNEIPSEGLTVDLGLEIMGTKRAGNVAGYHTTNKNMITLVPNEAENLIKMTIQNGVKGDAVVTFMRDPDGTNDEAFLSDWVARVKIVVANNLSKPDKPVWTDGKLSWEAVDKAVSYKVALYKNGTFIEEQTVSSTEVDLNSVIAANGNGDYTAKVTAYGDISYEVSEASELSDGYSYAAGLAQVDKPAWSADNQVLSWNGVDGANKYVICIYKNNGEQPYIERTVDAKSGVNTYDFASDFANESATFKATVQAKANDGRVGNVSELSDEIVVTKTYTISGNVKLEAVRGTKADNLGIKVTLTDGKQEKVCETDINGNYKFEDVPDGIYQIKCEKKYYMNRVFKVDLGTDKNVQVDDNVLYYGKFASSNKRTDIYYADISGFLKYYGKYDMDIDIDEDDGYVDITELARILKNQGKKPSDAYNK